MRKIQLTISMIDGVLRLTPGDALQGQNNE
jgi:hypothetical protein